MESVRTGAAKLFGGSGYKRTRSDSSSTVGGSTAGGAGGSGARTSSTAEPLNAQSRSFAQAAAPSVPAKRSGPSAPAFPRPSLRRGPVAFQHDDYASMERPAPATAAPNTLFMDIRQATITPEAILAAAFAVLGKLVLGFQFFAAQKAIGLTFVNAEAATHYRNKTLGEDGPLLYPAPPKPADLIRLTLQGVPYWNKDGILATLPALLAPFGELVFLAPMVTADGWLSDQWHATIVRKEGATDLPPDTIQLCGVPVIVDVPGQRRFCRHCSSSTHYKTTCRQWQRQRSRQAQADRDKAHHDAVLQQQLQPAHNSTNDTTTTGNNSTSTDSNSRNNSTDTTTTARKPVLQQQQTTEELYTEQSHQLPHGQRSAFEDAMDTDRQPDRESQLRVAQAILANAANHDPAQVAAANAFVTSALAEAGGANQ